MKHLWSIVKKAVYLLLASFFLAGTVWIYHRILPRSLPAKLPARSYLGDALVGSTLAEVRLRFGWEHKSEREDWNGTGAGVTKIWNLGNGGTMKMWYSEKH